VYCRLGQAKPLINWFHSTPSWPRPTERSTRYQQKKRSSKSSKQTACGTMVQRITTKRREAKNRKQTKQQSMSIPAYGRSFALHAVPNIKKSWPSVITAPIRTQQYRFVPTQGTVTRYCCPSQSGCRSRGDSSWELAELGSLDRTQIISMSIRR